MPVPHGLVRSRRQNAYLLAAATAAFLLVGCERNQPPSVSPIPPLTVDAGERATLAGQAMDPDGSVVDHRWEQVAGVPVSIQENGRGAAQFVAPLVERTAVLTFRLTVTDNGGATADGEVAVTVEPYGSLSVALSGTVRSHASHAPVSGARVTVSQHSDGTPHLVGEAVSDAGGAYALEVPARPGRLAVSVDAEGFAEQSEIVALGDAASSRVVHLDLVPVQASQLFAAAEDVDVLVDGQQVVSLPANAVVTAAGEAHHGQAVASVAVLDPSKDPSVMPGDFLQWDADANAPAPIESYGAIDVRLAAVDGAPLQLGSSGAAQVSIPLASGRSPADAPSEMPLYYWSSELGYWIEEGQARLEETSEGWWRYVGAVTHFTTWNADVAYESVWVSGCVADGNGDPVGHADITARGIDYVGTSSATADGKGRFEIRVRPGSKVELVAASRDESSEAVTLATGAEDSSLQECLALLGERGLSDFPIQIEGESGTVEVCVRDHECEDGDAISVDVEGRNLFVGELVNDAQCNLLEVEAGKDYVIELTALNGTGFKGDCNFADANTGEIRVSGLNVESQIWRHREGTGSQARIIITTGVPQPFTIVPVPPDAAVRFTVGPERGYQPGMELVTGEYRVEVSASGYKSREVAVDHGSAGPTRHEVTLERTFKPGDVFADALTSGGEGPEMVVIPAGTFQMGCLSGDSDCYYNEKPVHEVSIKQPFALSVHEVTFADWDACLAAGGCGGHEPDDEGWGRGIRPVINVSRDDAQAYASWLSEQTGAAYRLPSEAEWGYAARAGTVTKYHWGNGIKANRANCDGCGSPWDNRQTAPIGSFTPNAFGLHDVHGNVWELVEDCWNASYRGAPSDGSDWFWGNCEMPVFRGGSWLDVPRDLRVTSRNSYPTGLRSDVIGFRVARTLIP